MNNPSFEFGLETEIQLNGYQITVQYSAWDKDKLCFNGEKVNIHAVDDKPADWFAAKTLLTIKALVEDEHKKMRDYLMVSIL